MNKSGKVFLIISIILAIILIIMTYLYFNALNSLRASLDISVNNSDILLKTNQAKEDAGFEIQIQENGSFKLIEQENSTERITNWFNYKKTILFKQKNVWVDASSLFSL